MATYLTGYARITVEGYEGIWDRFEGPQGDLTAYRSGRSVRCESVTMTPCKCEEVRHDAHFHLQPRAR